MKRWMQTMVTSFLLLATSVAYCDEVLPTGLGEAVDRDVERVRAATERFKDVGTVLAAGYVATDHCVQHPGTLRLNGVECVVPLSAWMHDEPPMLLGQKMRREEHQAIWYLHAWIWEWNPSGIFADWNPRVNC